MNLDDYSYAENDRRYIKPEVGLNESNAFIDNFRNIASETNEQNRQTTYNLGSALPSNLGGLSGSNSYFQSRYQTPQVDSMVSDLRATAQAQALQDAMNNELNKAKKLYTDAYRAAKKRGKNNTDDPEDGNNLKDLLDALTAKTKSDGSGDIENLEQTGESDKWADWNVVTNGGKEIGSSVTWYPHETYSDRVKSLNDQMVKWLVRNNLSKSNNGKLTPLDVYIGAQAQPINWFRAIGK